MTTVRPALVIWKDSSNNDHSNFQFFLCEYEFQMIALQILAKMVEYATQAEADLFIASARVITLANYVTN